MLRAPLEKPDLTLPEAEAAWLRACCEAADTILEYGSGGSTVVAAGMAGKRVFSVESDAEWLARMEAWFAAHPPQAALHLHHGDIGPTLKWGHPAGPKAYRSFHQYPLSVWDREDFVHPDLVLIDGRFRVACFYTVLMRATRPVTVLFDDYIEREHYHGVEEIVPRAELRGRMARFEITPQPVPPERLTGIIAAFADKR